MRIRPLVVALAAVTTLFGAPAHAAPTSADFRMTLDIACLGCNATSVHGTFECLGVCLLDGAVRCLGSCTAAVVGTADVPAITCPLSGKAQGTIGTPTDAGFTLTWVSGGFALAVAFPSTAVAQATGTAVTSPVGIPCGGPATVTFVGHLFGY